MLAFHSSTSHKLTKNLHKEHAQNIVIFLWFVDVDVHTAYIWTLLWYRQIAPYLGVSTLQIIISVIMVISWKPNTQIASSQILTYSEQIRTVGDRDFKSYCWHFFFHHVYIIFIWCLHDSDLILVILISIDCLRTKIGLRTKTS